MQAHSDLVKEHDEVHGRLGRLETLMASEDFPNWSDVDKDAAARQREAMLAYRDVLVERVERGADANRSQMQGRYAGMVAAGKARGAA